MSSSTLMRWRDLLIYIIIALAVAAALYLYAVDAPLSWFIESVWVGFLLNTAVVFGFVIKRCRRYLRIQRFWWATLGLLAIHLVVYVSCLRQTDRFPLLWYVILNPVEWSVVFAVLRCALNGKMEER